MAVKKGGLGRGLDSLFNENAEDSKASVLVSLNDIEPNKDQPRKDFDEQSISDLADSISKHGLLQPIIVKPLSNGRYSIIAGERRWRACRMAEITRVPVIIKETDEQSLMEIALIENLQREDLNAVEEALGYRSLIDSFNLTQEEVAERIGKSRSAVTNALRLLNLNEEELSALRSGGITAGHARTLLSCGDELKREQMLAAAKAGASVRDLENMAKAKPAKKETAPKKDIFIEEVKLSLKKALHRKVSIKSNGKGKGTITLEFYNKEELADFARKLARNS
ncbi:MAG: ParB/RepB/Spo0J family partition protein, partial [Clostridia bacterium]|nr:ParB/RepB/Spo0J family partition protein [Clostridia bacterium]